MYLQTRRVCPNLILRVMRQEAYDPPVRPRKSPVKAQLIMYIQADQQTGGNPQGKPADLYGGIKFLLSQLTKSDLPEVFEHISGFAP